MLTIDNLTLIKNNKTIFKNLGFSISTSSALIIKGKNGSGKTTLLKIIAGICKASSGKILWGNEDINNFRDDFTGDLQFIGHKNFLNQNLTILQNLHFFTQIYDSEPALLSALNFFDLKKIKNYKIKNLSAGWQKKVMLAKLLACPSTIWILDEPMVNLDKDCQQKLLGLIKTRIKENGIVILTCHNNLLDELGPKINIEDFSDE
jgi:heme exporter protein A